MHDFSSEKATSTYIENILKKNDWSFRKYLKKSTIKALKKNKKLHDIAFNISFKKPRIYFGKKSVKIGRLLQCNFFKILKLGKINIHVYSSQINLKILYYNSAKHS